MKMKNFRCSIILSMAICCIFLLFSPVNAADPTIIRTALPATPQAGESVNVTLTIPPGFFGGIIEQIPEGFTFVGTTHPHDGVRQSGQTVIFALTGENTVQYTIQAPASGCGVIEGEWENVGLETNGTIQATVIAVNGTDPSHCTASQHSPGFGMVTALVACMVSGLILLAGKVRR